MFPSTVRIKEQNNSLFKNGLSKNTADVKLRRSSKHITPQKLCGNVAECRHDYKATGNIEVARASVYANFFPPTSKNISL